MEDDGEATRTLLPRAERRAQILRAAARAFAAGGYAATSMEDVAGEAGVTKLIVYRHFDSKEALYRAVLDQVVDRLRAGAPRPGATTEGPGRTAVRSLLSVAREDPDGYRLLVFHAVREPAFEAQARGYFDDAVAVLDAVVGPLVPDPALRPWAVRVLMSHLLHEVLAWLEVGDPAHDEALVATAGDGLRGLVAAWSAADDA